MVNFVWCEGFSSLIVAIKSVIPLRATLAGRKCLPILSVDAYFTLSDHSQRRRLEPNDIKAHQRPVNKWQLPISALQPRGAPDSLRLRLERAQLQQQSTYT